MDFIVTGKDGPTHSGEEKGGDGLTLFCKREGGKCKMAGTSFNLRWDLSPLTGERNWLADKGNKRSG